ncbi:MAG: hypothetical protein N4A62_21135 [Marinisporobacter sp.]|nr:hypothetical protein [Marinisporobacter sp.]
MSRIKRDNKDVIDRFIEKCRDKKYFPSLKELVNEEEWENGKIIRSIIVNNFKSLKSFSEDYGLEEICEKSKKLRLKNRKTKKVDVEEFEKECKKIINKNVKKIGNKKVFVGNIKDLNLKVYPKTKRHFRTTDYLRKNDIRKIPSHVYKLIKNIENEKNRNGEIDLKKWSRVIHTDKKIISSLYNIYKRDVLQKLLKDYDL